jgi:poly(A) polymerase
MALSRERIADELLKLLGVADPSATIAIMLDQAILRPVLPEIDAKRIEELRQVIAAEERASIEPNALRRLAALLPGDPATAEDVAARLRLSNKARKRLACSAEQDLGANPKALAYRLGIDCAVDRLLLAGKAEEAARIASWHPPRLPVGGGALIRRGLPQGPIVAQTLRHIENRWVEAGFPKGDALEEIVSEALATVKSA